MRKVQELVAQENLAAGTEKQAERKRTRVNLLHRPQTPQMLLDMSLRERYLTSSLKNRKIEVDAINFRLHAD